MFLSDMAGDGWVVHVDTKAYSSSSTLALDKKLLVGDGSDCEVQLT